MRTLLLVILLSFVLLVCGLTPSLAFQLPPCGAADSACREFAKLLDKEQFEMIAEKAGPASGYSVEAKVYIGEAYLGLAGREGNTTEQEERYCKKAIEYGAQSGYMGLYFINADQDPEAALGYLRQYVATKPVDSVPYVILGEAELAGKNNEKALDYLKEARKVARGSSANLDWLLFQASFLTGDHAGAAAMLDSSIAQGRTAADLKDLIATDARFAELKKKSEYRKFSSLLD